jgi:hypothetical protein
VFDPDLDPTWIWHALYALILRGCEQAIAGVQEGLSLWWLGTAAMAVARVEPGEAEVGADAGVNERRRIVTGAIRLPGKGEA